MKTVCPLAQGRNKTLNSTQRVNEMFIVIDKAEVEDYENCLRAQGRNKTLKSTVKLMKCILSQTRPKRRIMKTVCLRAQGETALTGNPEAAGRTQPDSPT